MSWWGMVMSWVHLLLCYCWAEHLLIIASDFSLSVEEQYMLQKHGFNKNYCSPVVCLQLIESGPAEASQIPWNPSSGIENAQTSMNQSDEGGLHSKVFVWWLWMQIIAPQSYRGYSCRRHLWWCCINDKFSMLCISLWIRGEADKHQRWIGRHKRLPITIVHAIPNTIL